MASLGRNRSASVGGSAADATSTTESKAVNSYSSKAAAVTVAKSASKSMKSAGSKKEASKDQENSKSESGGAKRRKLDTNIAAAEPVTVAEFPFENEVSFARTPLVELRKPKRANHLTAKVVAKSGKSAAKPKSGSKSKLSASGPGPGSESGPVAVDLISDGHNIPKVLTSASVDTGSLSIYS